MLIGRENEIATLHGLMSSDESQFVAVYGRRRVGKTFLIREAYKNHFVFQHTGTYGATRRQQLSDFRESLYLAGMGKCAMPKTWSEAFGLLWNFLNTFPETKRRRLSSLMNFPGWTLLNQTLSVHSTISGTHGLLREKTLSWSSVEAPHHGLSTMWS